jgi:hypothetical protein
MRRSHSTYCGGPSSWYLNNVPMNDANRERKERKEVISKRNGLVILMLRKLFLASNVHERIKAGVKAATYHYSRGDVARNDRSRDDRSIGEYF